KSLLLSIVILYFVVGFFSIVLFLGYAIGANAAGIIALAYLGVGWYFLIKRNLLLDLMKIKHD
ncbi:hypothetical protein M1316_00425, partial [Candidatus Parvarchaeota archaeon]|nr:hypothetical protein [Candidatus Parvarchaeota archaeon]